MVLGVIALGIVIIFGKAFSMRGAARRKMIVAFIFDAAGDYLLRTVQPDADVAELLCHS